MFEVHIPWIVVWRSAREREQMCLGCVAVQPLLLMKPTRLSQRLFAALRQREASLEFVEPVFDAPAVGTPRWPSLEPALEPVPSRDLLEQVLDAGGRGRYGPMLDTCLLSSHSLWLGLSAGR